MGEKPHLCFGQTLKCPKIWLLAFLVAGTLLLLNDRFLFESVQVTSSSMRPTLLPNERAWLQRRFTGNLQRFDVVVIQSRALGHRIVKRIIALPGERVQLEDSWRVWVNGQPLDYAAITGTTNRFREAGAHEIQLQRNPKFFYETKFGREELSLDPDEFYVLGDNRLASGDSRDFGVVRREEIQGRLTRIWYSRDLKTGRMRWERLGVAVR